MAGVAVKLAALLLIPAAVSAQPFVEVGVGVGVGGCIARHGDVPRVVEKRPAARCSGNPLGIVAIGYEISDQWRVQLEHWSSVAERDRGAEILSIRYRYTFK